MATPVTPLKTAAETELLRQFESAKPANLAGLRQSAIAHIAKDGLPHRRIEAWHYTDLRSLMRHAAPLAAVPSDEATRKRPWSLVADDDVIAFVDGYLVKTPKLPKGVTITNLADQPDAVAKAFAAGVDLCSDPVTSLVTAFMTGGLHIEIAARAEIASPIALSFQTTGATASHARIAVTVGAGAKTTFIETHRGAKDAEAQQNTVVSFVLGEGASVEHVRVNASDASAQTLSTLSASIAREASFNTLTFTSGAALSRHQVFARLHGDDAKIGARGIGLLNARQHADSTLVIEHDALNGISRELFRTVVDDEARGVFQGKIIVKPGAQKTDGQMASNALLLGENASMHGKPELEIFADDVVCAHGATVGALDHDLLFYLMSRGVPRNEAEGLIIQAFVGEVLETIVHDELREALITLASQWIAARRHQD
jgi:Fe-S cluster assembly protein SufD